jgi:dTDP-4-amino-4,6-dideoxygalactose transaminase
MHYPATGKVKSDGFASFLDREMGDSRRNLKLFASELKSALMAPQLTLVNSGSSANLIAALWVRERNPLRKKVLLSAFSFPTTISSFELLGFQVQLVDVEADGFNLSVDAVGAIIDEQTAAVVPTHFLGFPAALPALAKLCRKHGALLVQDACETMNLEVDGKSLYEYGDIITHSFYHPHHLSSFGGGAVIVASAEDHRLTESLSHWGRACTCHFDREQCQAPSGINHNFFYQRLGINVELSELNACFGRFQLQTWPQQEALRIARYDQLYRSLHNRDGICVYQRHQNISPFVFPIRVAQDRFESTTTSLRERGLEIRNLMGGAIHLHPAFKHLGHPQLTHAETMGASTFFVGFHQNLSDAQFAGTMQHLLEIVS